MIRLIQPSFYDDFHCAASRCTDTCCQQWDIDIDPETAARYQTLSGDLGQRIRSAISQGEDGPIFAVEENGHCPMHRSDGLCAIQAALGEEALCQVCREFPRLRHDYGDFVELGLEMSCPEAARILLTAPSAPAQLRDLPGDGQADYDRELMALLQDSRKAALDLLADPALTVPQALALLFLYGCHIQGRIDGEEAGAEFSRSEALETARELGAAGDFSQIPSFFLDLDILTEEWRDRLQEARLSPLSPLCRNLGRYLVGRYWLQAVSDYDLYSRVKFILISCLLISSLGGDFIDTAHLWSKEIENDCDNLEAILDAAYESPVFTDRSLLGYLR